ncbi:MAG: cobalt-precorrin-5B (C(1))-methyltransferase [Isosphaeraceae bacterium]
MARPRENLRTGYTTGACATAATAAALGALVRQENVREVTIPLPIGRDATFVLHSCAHTRDEGRASVIKDAGDDPDVTHGAEIRARVTWSDRPGVHFLRGVGVGLVTRRGLSISPGEPAINPVPRQMMTDAVGRILAGSGRDRDGVNVEISVPAGEVLAAKTFNPRLGIVGGISILGTTGIVEPYSTSAWLASVLQGIDVAVAQDCRHLVLTVGAGGERFARPLFDLPEVAFVQVGPFFGEAVRRCGSAGVDRVSLLSMIGKLAKFAAGHESVHSRDGTQDFHFLAEVAREAGAGDDLIGRVLAGNTAQEVSELMTGAGLTGFHERICRRARTFGASIAPGAIDLEVILMDRFGKVLARSPR